MLVALLAQAALAQNPLAVTHPKALPFSVLYANDYPFEARRHGWEGTVIADLTISARGAVDKCDIVKSSGYKLLDDTTCSILVKRARFHPAHDKDGKAVADMVRSPGIHWEVTH
jgi:protein TonB